MARLYDNTGHQPGLSLSFFRRSVASLGFNGMDKFTTYSHGVYNYTSGHYTTTLPYSYKDKVWCKWPSRCFHFLGTATVHATIDNYSYSAVT